MVYSRIVEPDYLAIGRAIFAVSIDLNKGILRESNFAKEFLDYIQRFCGELGERNFSEKYGFEVRQRLTRASRDMPDINTCSLLEICVFICANNGGYVGLGKAVNSILVRAGGGWRDMRSVFKDAMLDS